MGKRERYEPGTFCWVDLVTTDAEGAKSFYGELFGWAAQDNPAGGEATYSMMSLDGDVVCGLFYMGDEMKSRNVAPYWQSYISVEDVGVVTDLAKEIGGEVLEEPFDVMDSGRSAVVRDPEGALLPLWQPKNHIGSDRVNDPGCFTWNELQTKDPEGASGFYSRLFGWETRMEKQDDAIVYVTINNRGNSNGGMMPMSPERTSTPPNWLTYFTSADMDASVEKINALGGGVHTEPMEIMPGSRIAIVHDPQGATFALFEGGVDE